MEPIRDCNGNPINYIDPTGHSWESLVSKIKKATKKVMNATKKSIEIEGSFGVGLGAKVKAGSVKGNAELMLFKQTHGRKNGKYEQKNQAVFELALDLWKDKLGVNMGSSKGMLYNSKTKKHKSFSEYKLGAFANKYFAGWKSENKEKDWSIGAGLGGYIIVGCDFEINFNISTFIKQMNKK